VSESAVSGDGPELLERFARALRAAPKSCNVGTVRRA
jgi:hypothetical protein